jgi:hypothetical protein
MTAPDFAAAGRGWKRRVPRPFILTFATFATVLVCAAHAAVAGANTVAAAGFGYLCLTLVMLGCASAFWTRARSAEGTLFIRWSFIFAAALSAAIGYFPSCTQGFLNTTPARQFQTACFNSSEALYMLAAVLFFAGVSRSIVIVDILQALIFSVLRFNLIYSPVTRDHFSAHHLLTGQIMALFLFIVAVRSRVSWVFALSLSFSQTRFPTSGFATSIAAFGTCPGRRSSEHSRFTFCTPCIPLKKNHHRSLPCAHLAC